MKYGVSMVIFWLSPIFDIFKTQQDALKIFSFARKTSFLVLPLAEI